MADETLNITDYLQVAVENRPKTFSKIGMCITHPLNWQPNCTNEVQDSMSLTTTLPHFIN